MPPGEPRPLTALPSVRARMLAFAAIVVAGVCGGLIGSSFASLQCKHDCTTSTGLGGIVGAVFAAAGVAVIAVLTLRAMGEWRRISEEQLYAEDAAAREEGAVGGDAWDGDAWDGDARDGDVEPPGPRDLHDG